MFSSMLNEACPRLKLGWNSIRAVIEPRAANQWLLLRCYNLRSTSAFRSAIRSLSTERGVVGSHLNFQQFLDLFYSSLQ
jgi:hypothetical protein